MNRSTRHNNPFVLRSDSVSKHENFGMLSVVDGLLLRAALLAGYGARARAISQRLASVVEAGDGRSCFDAGTPVQLSIDAPGPAGLRVGLRLRDGDIAQTLDGLVPADAVELYARMLAALPLPEHASLGTWLFWTEQRQSLFIDLRDRTAETALARLKAILSSEQRERLDEERLPPNDARPWAFHCEVQDGIVTRQRVHWLLARHAQPRKLAETVAPGCFDAAMDALGHLVRRPGACGRWTIDMPLDEHSEPALRIGNTGWLLTPEDDGKQRAIGRLMTALGGQRDFAEALWSLCKGAAAPDWRVGRACEFKVTTGGAPRVRARLFLSPDVQVRATAGTSSSPGGTVSMAPSDADPSIA